MKWIKTVPALMLVFVFINLSLAQNTYTQYQYLSMLPDWSKIDTSRLVIPSNETEMPQHRTWYWLDALFRSFLNTELPLSNNYSYHIIAYCWNPSGCPNLEDCPDAVIIVAIYNIELSRWEGAFWINEDGIYSSNFPKVVCDYSIKDLPIKTYGGKLLLAMLIPMIAGIIILVTVGVTTKKP